MARDDYLEGQRSNEQHFLQYKQGRSRVGRARARFGVLHFGFEEGVNLINISYLIKSILADLPKGAKGDN